MTTPAGNTTATGASSDQPMTEYQMLKRVSLDMMTTIQFQNTAISLTNALTTYGNNVMDALKSASADYESTNDILTGLNWGLAGLSAITAVGGVGAAGLAEGTIAIQAAEDTASATLATPTAVFQGKQGEETATRDTVQGLLQLTSQKTKGASSTTSTVTNSQDTMGNKLLQTLMNDAQAQRRHRS